MEKKLFYITTPCKRCGCVERYKSNNLCPVCKAEANRRYKARKAKAAGKEYKPREPLPPLQVNAVSRRENVLKAMINVLLGMFAMKYTKKD